MSGYRDEDGLYWHDPPPFAFDVIPMEITPPPGSPEPLPGDIREIVAFFLDRPEDQREGFEEISALVRVLLEKRGEGAFTCPCCSAVSHNPHDLEQGYCGRCHWWTADPVLGPPHLEGSCEARTAR